MLFYDDQTIHTFHNVGFWRIEIVLLCSKFLFCWNWHSSVGDQDVMVLQTKTSGCLSFALKMFCKNKILRWKCFAKTCTAAIDYFTAHVTSQWDAPGYYYPLKSSDASFTMGLFHLITSFLYSHSHTLSHLAKKLGIILLMSEMKFFQAFWESQQGRLAKTNHPAPPRENRAHCAGGHFRWKKISRYVEIHRKNRFDVTVQELVSKLQFCGHFFEKKSVFLAHFWVFMYSFLVGWTFWHQSAWNFSSRAKIDFFRPYKKFYFDHPFLG